jgi:hypothetical protein
MPWTSPFHTDEPETPQVYHDNSACPDGKRIKNPILGKDGRRRCYECDKLAAEGQ